jgi:DNA (cytosine-5)-methyltransferase 1
MRAVDLFCCEGGAGQGYRQAGFSVDSVDIRPQPRNPNGPFYLADASTFPLDGYDLAHGSPPCEDHSVTMGFGLADRGTGWLLPHTLERFERWAARTGGLYVVENVESRAVRAHMLAAVARTPRAHLFRLCGSGFGLGAHDSRGRYRILRRHRLFVANFPVTAPPCTCRGKLVGGVYGNGEQGVNGGRGYGFAADAARQALGTPWMTRNGAAECIPPAYTRHIGGQARAALTMEGAA